MTVIGSPQRKRSALVGLGLASLCYGVAALGTLTMRGRGAPDRVWFRSLRKSRAEPPSRVFGPVWTALYGMIAYSGWRVWKASPSRTRTRALALWASQLALNGAWTPLFFGARRPRVALADIAALDAAVATYAVTASKVDRTAALAVVPYLGWIGFATYLNGSIVARNRS
jgi:benzodiazapine receptor